MKKNRVYLDTNIVIDIIQETRKHHDQALKMLQKLIISDYAIAISEDILSTLYYISKNKSEVLNFFKYVIFVDWEVVSFGQRVLKESVEFSLKNNLDLEDTLQCLCAKDNGCQILMTTDKKFVDCGIEILNYDQFLKKIL